MSIVLIVLILGAIFFAWIVFAFLKYKKKEARDKREVHAYIASGLTLAQAIEKAFFGLNEDFKMGLSRSTISTVANEIAGLKGMMSADNVIEIYSTFIHRYIFRDDTNKDALNIEDSKILYALSHLNFDGKGGYFVIRPDANDEDFDKKYPTRNT